MSLALVVSDESCQEQAAGSAVSAPRAAGAQENTSHRLQNEVKQLPARNGTFWALE